VNVETKEQSKQWIRTHSPNKPKKFKQTLAACQKADKNSFVGPERSDGGIHATWDHNNIRSVLQNTVHCTDNQHAKSSHEMQSALMLTEFLEMYYTR
jgi:hypothetical protein